MRRHGVLACPLDAYCHTGGCSGGRPSAGAGLRRAGTAGYPAGRTGHGPRSRRGMPAVRMRKTVDSLPPGGYTIITSMKSITKMKKEVLPVKKGQHIFGTVKVGEKGQIVIPKEARRIFGIKPGDTLLVLGDEAQGPCRRQGRCHAGAGCKHSEGPGHSGRRAS